MTARRVVLIAGPPGAGKTTRARLLARRDRLRVYDYDDPSWRSQRVFRDACSALAEDPAARAVVIRSLPRAMDLADWIQRVIPTEIELLRPTRETCQRRIAADGCQPQRLAGVRTWFDLHATDPWTASRTTATPSRDW